MISMDLANIAHIQIINQLHGTENLYSVPNLSCFVLPLTELMLGADSFATLTRPPSKLACLEAALGAAVRTCRMSQLPNLLVNMNLLNHYRQLYAYKLRHNRFLLDI